MRGFLHKLLLLFVMVSVLGVGMAQAGGLGDPPPSIQPPDGATLEDTRNIDTCTASSGYTEDQITSRVVYCIKMAILNSVFVILSDLMFYMEQTLVTAVVLACTIYGMRILGGEPQVYSRTMAALIRWCVVVTLYYYLPTIAYYAFTVSDWLLSLVVDPYWSPWVQIDTFLGKFLGFGKPETGLTLVNGVAGIILAIAVSGTSGFGVFSIALMAFYGMMMFVLEIVYTYLAAMLVIGFMMVVAPFIIPLVLFNYTERYFTKWLQNLIGAMLLPMFLFGFLYMSLNMFDELITDALNSFSQFTVDENGNPDFAEFFRANMPSGSWIATGNPNDTERLRKEVNSNRPDSARERKVMPAMPTEINSTLRVGQEMNKVALFGTSYSPSELREILFSMLALFIYVAMLMGLIKKMPSIASAIAKSVTINVALGTSFKAEATAKIENAGVGLGTIAGGWVGSNVGGAFGSRSRSFGAWTGAAIGGQKGGELGTELAKRIGLLTGRRE